MVIIVLTRQNVNRVCAIFSDFLVFLLFFLDRCSNLLLAYANFPEFTSHGFSIIDTLNSL